MIDYLGLFLLSGLAGFALGRLYFAIRETHLEKPLKETEQGHEEKGTEIERLYQEFAKLNAAAWYDIWTFESDHPLVKRQAEWWENKHDATMVSMLSDASTESIKKEIKQLESIIEERAKRRKMW